jgi:mannose-6-phosphate isomerase-like protein (cupin superfamily)
MDIKEYIESGVLEEYCLGLLSEEQKSFLIQMAMLYPEVKEELIATELAMEKLASSNGLEPGHGIKQRILDALGFGDDKIERFPALTKDADHQTWLKNLAHLIPSQPSEDFYCEVIRKDDNIQQMLVVVKTDVPEEDHDGYLESFFILKGHCECTVGDKTVNLFAGDYLEIPLHVKHDIKIMSPHVVAVLQYQFV